ncbi:MAG: glycoside hydrolase family 140 protein [Bacteroidaceae bacterium]|nr:glycoside hydrolase family 140 protein [Bacteroidaceae bacterium]
MKKLVILIFAIMAVAGAVAAPRNNIWEEHGWVRVSDNHRYLQHADGTPFFYLADTGWLMPERLSRDEVDYYLNALQAAGFNAVQVQVVNAVPTLNAYGQYSHNPSAPFDFACFGADSARALTYSYWDHMEYIVNQARVRGIMVGMVCAWGGVVKGGKMNADEAALYGRFLVSRFKNYPNIMWIIGGDIQGTVRADVWNSLASSIRSLDKKHLMTYHPFGRTSSAMWFNESSWLDVNMFQSGHRRYGQADGDGDHTTIKEDNEEDSWRYVEEALKLIPLKPIFDGEPSYERIPQGLHDPSQPKWQARDARRYAWWSVIGGACGHTYGNAAIMQFAGAGRGGAYGIDYPWFEALKDEGFTQMHHLKDLMLRLPYFEREPDQSVFVGKLGVRYERPVASRGAHYIVAYTYTASPMTIDLSKTGGKRKKAWWYSPRTGGLTFIGEFDRQAVRQFRPAKPNHSPGNDWALVIVDSEKHYLD